MIIEYYALTKSSALYLFFSAFFAKNFALFAVKNLRLTAKNAENAQSTQRLGL
jgi:hypothetical protein